MRLQDIIGGMVTLSILMLSLGAWATHVITCLQDDRWGFLIAGAIAFPIAVVHGVYIWIA